MPEETGLQEVSGCVGLTEYQKRTYSQYYALLPLLLNEDEAAFRRQTRITPEMWHHILERVGPQIQKKDTQKRLVLELGSKLAVTLRYLATGETFRNLAFGYSFNQFHRPVLSRSL